MATSVIRFPYQKIQFPVYKPSRISWTHKVPRDSFLKDPYVKYPIYKRLPSFWREEYEEKMPILHQEVQVGTKRPQHEGLWKIGEFGAPERAETIPVEVIYPPESKEGIWGGEGYVEGKRYSRGGPRNGKEYNKIWKPLVLKHTAFSEVLDLKIPMTVTPLTLDLIDEAFGFDFFLLKTSTKRLQELGGRLKRKVLITLAQKDELLYPNDPDKREAIYKKYQDYVIPLERAEWVGLTLKEAMEKQWQLEKDQGLHDPVPLLKIYKEQLLKELCEAEENPTTDNIDQPVAVFEMDKKERIEAKQ